MQSFWQQLKSSIHGPIIGLSPMDGVTDHPYRFITKKYGRPDVVYTEFTSVEGVCRGAQRLLKDFLFDETQRPIVAQVYGTTPDFFRQSAVLLCELGFDGIDINMGCPAKNVAHSGAGAALILTPELAQEIVRATQLGVQQWHDGMTIRECTDVVPAIADEIELRHALLPLAYQTRDRVVPVSVKTRVGYAEKTLETWLPYLLELDLAAIAMHGRTLKQHYSGEASWEELAKSVGMRNAAGVSTLLLGNGDLQSREMAEERCKLYGFDGALIGRASFGAPDVFLKAEAGFTIRERAQIALEHAQLFEQTYKPDNEKFSFMPMRKHLGWYIRGIPGASEIRVALFQSNSADEVAEIFQRYDLIDGEGMGLSVVK